MTSGRSLNWLNALKSWELFHTVTGGPVCNVVAPEICQPPNTCLFTPLFHPNKRCPGPTGKSITYVMTARCRMSNDEGPRSAFMLLTSATPVLSPVEPKNADA